MLGEHELATSRETGPRLPELTQLGVERSLWALVERKAGDRVAKDVGNQCENGPPVTGSARGRPGLGDGIAICTFSLIALALILLSFLTARPRRERMIELADERTG